MLAWLIEAAQGKQKAVIPLTQRMLGINHPAIHTTSMVSLDADILMFFSSNAVMIFYRRALHKPFLF